MELQRNSPENTSDEEDKMHYPRTGKRGVPQQFPRKLYEMLEFESGSGCASWTASGRGFRIINTSLFSETVLPKWFKTSKFSSFQRNLNLYGFTKIRKGEHTVYYHPKFAKGEVDELPKIRKRDTISAKGKKQGVAEGIVSTDTGAQMKSSTSTNKQARWGSKVYTSYGGRLDMLTYAMRLVMDDETNFLSSAGYEKH